MTNITTRGVEFTTENHAVVEACQVVVLAVKPHLYSEVLQTLQTQGRAYGDKLWVSIMAGVVLADLAAAIGLVTSKVDRVVRTIPNTPCKVSQGSVGVTYSPGCTGQDREVVTTIFSSVARCNEIPERLQNAFAAMAGSGPAYIYQVIEALSDGGVMMGLPRALATEHAAAMVQGAASMVLQGDKHPALLKDEVCSPGGSTIRSHNISINDISINDNIAINNNDNITVGNNITMSDSIIISESIIIRENITISDNIAINDNITIRHDITFSDNSNTSNSITL